MDRRPYPQSGLPTRLRKVHRVENVQTLVITVPGVGTAPPEEWRSGPTSTWVTNGPQDLLPGPAVYAYDHGLDVESVCSWAAVFQQSPEFLEAVLLLKDSDDQLRSCATVFMAHSIGGVIVKKALCLAFQTYSHLHPLTNAIAAVILMGVPHSRSAADKDWNNAQTLLSLRIRYKKKQKITPEDANRLAALSTQFEEVAADLPMLSVVEQIPTQLKGIFPPHQKVKLIDKDFAKTGSRLEKQIEAPGDHYDICKVLFVEPTLQAVVEFLKPAVAKAQERIQRQIGEYDRPPLLDEPAVGKISNSSPTDSIAPMAFDISNHATFASDVGKERMAQLPDFSIVSRGPRLPCHLVPFARNKDFCGRRDILDALEENLLPRNTSEAVTGLDGEHMMSYAICGTGGMGKTQIAAEYALSHLDDYDAVFWLHADEPQRLASDFSRIAIDLGLVLEASRDAMDLDVTRELVLGWLAKPVRSYDRLDGSPDDEASWLLVFDNLGDRELLSRYWPPVGSSGSVLITSRDPLAKTGWYNNVANGADLGTLCTKDATSLLLKKTWRECHLSEQHSVHAVAERLGCFPLALTQMAGIMTRQDLSFEEFAARYDEEEAHRDLFHLSFDISTRPEAYVHTVASVWALENLKKGSGLLAVLSMLDPDGIPEKMLEQSVGKISHANFPSTATDYQTARSELLNSCLISKDREAKKILVHRLIQDGTRARMTKDQFIAAFSAATEAVCNVWPSTGFGTRHNVDRWMECEELSPHVIRLKNRFSRLSQAARAVLAENLHFAHLLNEFGWYFQERARADDAMDCFELAQSNLKSFEGVQHLGNPLPDISSVEGKVRFLLAETHRNIGCSAAETNRAELARHHFQVYNEMMQEQFRDISTGGDTRLPMSFMELATAYTMLENYDEAMRCNKSALHEAQKLTDNFRGANIRTLTLTNLACVYLLTGHAQEAFSHASAALEEREEMYGVNDRQSMITGRVLHALGNITAVQGDLNTSLDYHQRALHHFQETVGNHHHRTADMCCKVAQHFVRAKRYNDAISLLDQALAVYREQSAYRGERARALFIKSNIYRVRQQESIAQEMLQRAGRLYRDVKPEDKRLVAELKDLDFDKVVHYWSR